MTNEQKVEEYFQEIENVFGTKEKILRILNNYDNFKEKNDLKSIQVFDSVTLGRHQNEYWIKFKIEKPSILNSFLMSWITQGKSIAGVEGSVLDFGGVCNKQELKDKLFKMIEEL